MTIVYSSAFDATVDTNLELYGNWYRVYNGGGASKVIAANDNVQGTLNGALNVHAVISSVIGGINDYSITARTRRGTGFETGGLAVRCGVAEGQTFYHLNTDAGDDMVLTRYVAAAPTILQTTALTISSNAIMTIAMRVTGTNPVVLTYSIDGNFATYSDSNAARLVTGTPGISMFRNGSPQANVWLDDFSVDNLLDPGGGGSGGGGSAGSGKRRVKEPQLGKILYRGFQGGGSDIDPFQWGQEKFRAPEPRRERVEQAPEDIPEFAPLDIGRLDADISTKYRQAMAARKLGVAGGGAIALPSAKQAFDFNTILDAAKARTGKRVDAERAIMAYINRWGRR